MAQHRGTSHAKKLLCALGEMYIDLLRMHRRWHNLDWALHPEYYQAKDRDRAERFRKRALRELKRQKMLAVRKKGKQLSIALTSKGRQWLLQHQCVQSSLCKKGEYVVAIFDIPETERGARSTFRHFLATHGFTQLQRSVWCTSRDLLQPLQQLIRESDATEWVRVFRAHDVFSV